MSKADVPQSVAYSISLIVVIANPTAQGVTAQDIADAVNQSKDKADRVLSALSAYPSGRGIIDIAETRRSALAILSSKSCRITVLFDKYTALLDDDDEAGVGWPKACEALQEATSKMAAEDVKNNSELAALVHGCCFCSRAEASALIAASPLVCPLQFSVEEPV